MITPKNHPIKFLLHFEWVLLAIVLVVELLPLPLPRGAVRSPLLNLVVVGVLLGLGLRLPDREPTAQWLHLVSTATVLIVGTFIGKVRLIYSLYIVVAARSCFIFSSYSRQVITGFIFVLAFLQQFERIQNRPIQALPGFLPPIRRMAEFREERLIIMAISSVLLLAIILLFIQRMVDAVLAEQQSRDRLEQANAQLRRYALRVEDVATLQERNRIAREIHDSLGHSLTAFNLHIEAALRLFQSDPDEAQALLIEAKQLAQNSLQNVRQSVSDLRSSPLKGQSLQTALTELVSDFCRSTGITPDVEIELQQAISNDRQMTLYRILQEALTNISKYAQANTVKISLSSNADQVQLQISDDGRGFDPNQITSGFGLQGMQERTQALDGNWQLKTQPHQGCQITVKIPN
jgi:signal transduction histidine kinase